MGKERSDYASEDPGECKDTQNTPNDMQPDLLKVLDTDTKSKKGSDE